MFKVLIMLFSFFTNIISFENNYAKLQKNLLVEENEIVYPNKKYSVNISNNQNLAKEGHLWGKNYNYTFSINLKDFNAYSFKYFNFKIEFELLERIIDKNNQIITNKNQIEIDYEYEMSVKTLVNKQLIEDLNSTTKIEYQSLVTSRLFKENDYIFTATITNDKASNKSLEKK